MSVIDRLRPAPGETNWLGFVERHATAALRPAELGKAGGSNSPSDPSPSADLKAAATDTAQPPG